MEALVCILLIIVLVVVLSANSNLKEKMLLLNKKLDITLRKLDHVSEELEQLRVRGLDVKRGDSFVHQFSPSQEEPVNAVPEVSPFVEERFDTPVVFEEAVHEVATSIPVEPSSVEENQEPVVKEIPVAAFVEPKLAPKPSFFERNPDLEKFIGENLINKIGIAILVLGIGFFVKYAIDQNWINEIGRVAIGIFCGGILLGTAHYLRKSFNAFSSVLVGGGLAVFYFTIAIAFQEYQLFSKEVAFGMMVAITGFAIVLSIAYNRIELAILAIVGGFSSPFFVSDGSGNYAVMFSYVLLLNGGMLVLAYFKRWNLVNIVSYVFTIVLYGGWLVTKVMDQPDPPYAGALVFGTLYFVVFFLMNIVNNVKENRKFVAAEISILLSNNVLYYSAGMYILKYVAGGAYQGLFTVALGVFNFFFAYFLLKSGRADRNLVYLLIGLVLTFASLAAPVQLEGNYITMFWALEAALLLWLSQKSGIRLIKISSVIVTALMILSLTMDWEKLYFRYSEEHMSLFLNKAFVTACISSLSLLVTRWLLKKEEAVLFSFIETGWYQAAISVAFVLLCYFTFFFEFQYQLDYYLQYQEVRAMYLGSYNLLFGTMLAVWIRKKETHISPYVPLTITGLLLLIYAFHYNICVLYTRNYALGSTISVFHYYYHYVLVAQVLFLIGWSTKQVFAFFEIKSSQMVFSLWFLCFFFTFLASAELLHLVVYAQFSPSNQDIDVLEHHVYQIGFPILWGVLSFVAMFLGMKYKLKTLRIISLSLFAFTLLKLFIFDVSKMSEGGKIAAFISLGVILLIVSFMYQKLKKLIIEDDAK